MFGLGMGTMGRVKGGALGRFVLSQIGAAVAFAASPRKVRDGYNGPAMRVRRSSDNAELDIGFLANGDLDVFGLVNHVGAENLLLWSEDFSSAAWQKTPQVTAESNVSIAPDGSTSADRVTSTLSNQYTWQAGVGTAGGTVTFSIWLRADSAISVGNIAYGNSSGVQSGAWSVTPEWKRFSVTYTYSAGDTDRRIGFMWTTTGSAYAWGAQLNTGPGTLDYCRTTSAPTVSGSGFVTRMYDQSGNARDLTQATAANQPRIVNAGVIDRVIVAENLILRSNRFFADTNGPGFTRTSNYTTGADGVSVDATRYQWTASPNSYDFSSFFNAVSGTSYTVSLRLKINTTLTSTLRVLLSDGSSSNSAGVALTNTLALSATVVSGAGVGAVSNVSITADSNGYTKVTFTTAITTALTLGINVSAASAGLGDVVVWGAQLNTGSTARTYCRTDATPVALGDAHPLNKPGYRTDGVSQSMATGSFAVPQPFTRSSVLQFSGVSGVPVFIDGSAGGDASLQTPATNTVAMYAGSVLTIKSSMVAGEIASICESYSGAMSVGSYNGAIASGQAGTNSVSGVTVGATRTLSRFANTIFSDIIIFPQALSTADRLALELNQKTYYGTP